MRILSERKLAKIREDAYAEGNKDGIRKGETSEYCRRVYEKLRVYKEAPVTIESITLVECADIEIKYCYPIYRPAQYEVKFRSKNGKTTNDMIVTFDSPDFSMADVRRKITEEFCGGVCK